MPEKAKVFVAEDDPGWQARIQRYLARSNHQLVLTAQSLPESLAAINRFQELQIQVAIIDGNLDNLKGTDGIELAQAIKDRAPNVKTIGFSALDKIPNTDVDLGKANIGKLGETINNL